MHARQNTSSIQHSRCRSEFAARSEYLAHWIQMGIPDADKAACGESQQPAGVLMILDIPHF